MRPLNSAATAASSCRQCGLAPPSSRTPRAQGSARTLLRWRPSNMRVATLLSPDGLVVDEVPASLLRACQRDLFQRREALSGLLYAVTLDAMTAAVLALLWFAVWFISASLLPFAYGLGGGVIFITLMLAWFGVFALRLRHGLTPRHFRHLVSVQLKEKRPKLQDIAGPFHWILTEE